MSLMTSPTMISMKMCGEAMIPGNLETLRSSCNSMGHYAIADGVLRARNTYYAGTATALVAAVGTTVINSDAGLIACAGLSLVGAGLAALGANRLFNLTKFFVI